MVDTGKENRDLILAVYRDRRLAVFFLRGSQGVVRIVPCKAAGRAPELADVIVMVILIDHRLLADGAVLAVVVDAFVDRLICRKLIGAEIDRAFPVLAKARNERIVSIKDQGHVIVDGLRDYTLYEFRMAVPGHLVPVKVIDNKIFRMEILEYIFPKDKTIFIMCGAGGYANFTKQMLGALGWDTSKIYNVGGFWNYEGTKAISTKVEGSDKCDFSKVPYHNIDFDRLTEVK